MNDPRLLWWVDRSAGLMSLLLLTVVVALGALATGRPGAVLGWRTAVQSLHRQLPITACALLTVHIGTAVADSFVPLGLLDVVLPFHAAWRPVWVGFGALTVDLLLVVLVTSLLRARLGARAWRWLHRLAYLLWPFAVVHALGSGTDVHGQLVQLFGLGCVALVALAGGWRVAVAAR